jgi:hypothetical protein
VPFLHRVLVSLRGPSEDSDSTPDGVGPFRRKGPTCSCIAETVPLRVCASLRAQADVPRLQDPQSTPCEDPLHILGRVEEPLEVEPGQPEMNCCTIRLSPTSLPCSDASSRRTTESLQAASQQRQTASTTCASSPWRRSVLIRLTSFGASNKPIEWLYRRFPSAYSPAMLRAYGKISPQLRRFVSTALSPK